MLPAQHLWPKDKPFSINDQGKLDYCVCERTLHESGINESHIDELNETYRYELLKLDKTNGLEVLEVTLEGISVEDVKKYVIFCAGNTMDSMDPLIIKGGVSPITGEDKTKYIFWNYPGVGCSKGSVFHPEDLVEGAYQQVKRLMSDGIAPKDITLHGLSLGGSVAIFAAKRLHNEGIYINLTVDRSFSSISRVLPNLWDKFWASESVNLQAAHNKDDMISRCQPLSLEKPQKPTIFKTANDNKFYKFEIWGDRGDLKPYSNVHLDPQKFPELEKISFEEIPSDKTFLPLMSATITCSILGITLGTMVAGIIATLGWILTLIPKTIAHILSLVSDTLFELILGEYLSLPFKLIAEYLDLLVHTLCAFIEKTVNIIGSLIGGIISLGGGISGALLSLLLGGLLSLQLLWTNNPSGIPLYFAFSAILFSTGCEMDSAKEIKELCSTENAHIEIHQTRDDRLIGPNSALASALEEYARRYVTWYTSGGHVGKKTEPEGIASSINKVI